MNNESSGFLLINKPKGITSFNVCSLIKKKCSLRKVGHCGTLDPNAIGLLIIAINEATKYSSYILNQNKEYLATGVFWEQRDTYDIDGKITKSIPTNDRFIVKKSDLLNTLYSFKGNITQVPPVYSAIKIKGVRQYQNARKGIIVEMKPRAISIESLFLLNYNHDTFQIKVHCSKGTYIRSLINDIGIKLKTFAYLSHLERTAISQLKIEDAIKLDSFLINPILSFQYSYCKTIESCLPFPKIIINDLNNEKDLLNGKVITIDLLDLNSAMFSVINSKNKFFGLVRKNSMNSIKPVRMMQTKHRNFLF